MATLSAETRREIVDWLVYRLSNGWYGDARDVVPEGCDDEYLISQLRMHFDHALKERLRLNALSDDELISKDLAEHEKFEAEKRHIAGIAAEEQRQEDERFSEKLREAAKKGGGKPKRLVGVLEACDDLRRRKPGIRAKIAWGDLLKSGYTSKDGRYQILSDKKKTPKLLQIDTANRNATRAITESTFRTSYWSVVR